ncbi:MAG: PAS domain S-box protein, partial [Polaromonas sp.]|nr:PAS domain S-box protein [Polaromonas sp.]
DGTEFPVDVSISQLDTPEGKLFTAIVRDLTDEQAAQAQLRLLDASISRLNDMLLITEAEPVNEMGPRIIFVNAAFERHTGYSREEALGQSPRMLQGPLTQRRELDRIAAALKKWQPVRAELINYTKSGQPFWVELDIVPVVNAQGWYTHWVSVQRDITERKRAEQALIDSEQRYAALFASAPVSMWVQGSKNREFLAVNQAAVQDYGYAEREFLSMTLADVQVSSSIEVPPDRPDLRPEKLQGPAEHRRRDGSLFPVEVAAQPIQFNGQSACLVVALDMTARFKAERTVQDQLATLQRAVEGSRAITQQLTVDGILQELAEQARGVIGAHQAAVSLAAGSDEQAPVLEALSLSGRYAPCRDRVLLARGSAVYACGGQAPGPLRLSQAEVQQHPAWREVASPAERDLMLRGWLAVPLTGRDGRQVGLLQLSDKYVGEFNRHDEHVAAELAQLACIAVKNVQLMGQVSRLNAGLEKKVAERTLALERQQALFHALAEQAPQIIWTIDLKGQLTYANRAWFELVGGSLENWTAMQWLAAIHPDDIAGMRENWQQARQNAVPFSGVRRLLCKDGSVHSMAYRGSPVLNAQGQVIFWVGIDADVTEFKQAEAALRRSNQDLEAFSYSVSHDLRAPLSTINGFSSLLARQLTDSGNPKVQNYLSRIVQGAAQMGRLIEGLLSLGQVTRSELRRQPVDLSAMAGSILDEWQARQPERVVDWQVQAGLLAYGDDRLIQAVLENLLGNAWKFSALRVRARISVGQLPDADGRAVFFVRDNGAGFDMAHAHKLFMPFERLHGTLEFAGLGIGLATVQRVIERHEGRLWAEAAPGQGATFYFSLPRQALPAY